MNCQQATKYIWDYCDNRLSPTVSETLEAHCAECAACRRHLHLTRMENEVLQRSDNLPPLSPDFTERVMKNLAPTASAISRQSSKRKRKEQLRHKWLGASTAILGTLLLLLILPGLFPKQTDPNLSHQPPSLGQVGSGQSQTASVVKQPINSSKAGNANQAGMDQADTSLTDGTDSGVLGSSGPRAGKTSSGDNPVSRSVIAAETSPNQEDINSYPFPVDFSTDYQMVSVNSIANNSVDFQFTRPDSNVVLDVIVSRLDTSPTAKNGTSEKSTSTPEPAPSPMNATSLGAAPPASSDAAGQSNSIMSWSIEENGQAYRVTLNGNLKPQELAEVASSMKFKIKK
ncbi:MAG TPA: zf-HC2 domain-containing protein [Syntrophomonadaceae bacterium]|nr:zf-HC2 domain-containing protein [Syntrophomonadaceae bacterium]